eukprot:2333563-Rhodomonas_salina.1
MAARSLQTESHLRRHPVVCVPAAHEGERSGQGESRCNDGRMRRVEEVQKWGRKVGEQSGRAKWGRK